MIWWVLTYVKKEVKMDLQIFWCNKNDFFTVLKLKLLLCNDGSAGKAPSPL